MSANHPARSAIVLAMLALAIVFPAPARIGGAEELRGSIHIHSRICGPFAVHLYQDCHPYPGPPGAVYTIDSRIPKAIDAYGNVSFGRARAGDHVVRLMTAVPEQYRELRAFCSNSTGGGVFEVAVTYQATPQFWARVAPGSRLTCDVYFIPYPFHIWDPMANSRGGLA